MGTHGPAMVAGRWRLSEDVPELGQALSGRVSPDGILPLDQALQIKAAEFWLKLGEADQALRELESLPQSLWNYPAAIKARVAAVHILREKESGI
jgi:hypothetical protein